MPCRGEWNEQDRCPALITPPPQGWDQRPPATARPDRERRSGGSRNREADSFLTRVGGKTLRKTVRERDISRRSSTPRTRSPHFWESTHNRCWCYFKRLYRYWRRT